MGRLLNKARNVAARKKKHAAKKVEPVSSLRPDQLLKQRREAEAAKMLAEKNRPRQFKPIVLPGDSKRGKQSFMEARLQEAMTT